MSEELHRQIADVAESLTRTSDLRPAAAPDRIAWHLARSLERALAEVREDARADVGIEVARDAADRIAARLGPGTIEGSHHAAPGNVLAVHEQLPDGRPKVVAEPLIPLLDTTLLTNAPGSRPCEVGSSRRSSPRTPTATSTPRT